MLRNTFTHIPGIGEKTEAKLWDAGVTGWDRLDRLDQCRTTQKKAAAIATAIADSKQRLNEPDPAYFAQRLKSRAQWRLFPEFRHLTAYLDIESDGLDLDYGHITTIALYDGQQARYYVNGRNLNDFKSDIRRYKVIVTYNGKTFDIPFIERYLGFRMPQAHIDLRYILGNLGFKGGLKRCEEALGIDRGDLKGVDGYFAVLLWNEYKKHGDEKALETLLAYNIADVVNLEKLMVEAYNLNVLKTPFGSKAQLPWPTSPELPFEPDLAVVRRIKDRIFRY